MMKTNLLLICLAASLLFTGCGSSNDFNDISGQQGGVIIPAAPIARDDAYTTNANTQLVVNAANGILANDSQLNSTIDYTTDTQNGTLVGAQDGSFVYTPDTNFTGEDIFTYTLTNGFGSSSATVTINVNAVVPVNGFFVDAATGNDGTGSFDNGLPFASVQAAANAAPVNATIVVRPGNYTGAVNLKNGQRLLGSGSTLINAQGATRPVLSGPVVLADGNTLDFLRIAGTAGNAVDADGQNGGTVTNCEFANTTAGTGTGTGVFADNVSGTWSINGNTFTTLSGTAVAFRITDTDSATIIINDNSMTGNGLAGVVLATEDNSNAKAQVQRNVLRGNNTTTGDAFELICSDSSRFGLNLEDNTNDKDTNPNNGEDGVYRVGEFNSAELKIEQFGKLTDTKPEGAGNTGIVNDSSTGTIEDVPRGTFTF